MLEVKNLSKTYTLKGAFKAQGTISAVSDISFTLEKEKTLGLVGESGCGKSTLAKTLMGLTPPTAGQVLYEGRSLLDMKATERAQIIQMVFQDPYNSLNPRKKAWQIIADPLDIQGGLSKAALRSKACELLEQVGLRPEWADRYPHMFSGGQRQRLGVARALATRPKILICDEPVSALDLSVQAQILNLLQEIQKDFGLSYLFITHDLSVVGHMSDELAVMYLGEMVEFGSSEVLLNSPKHPYTKALTSARPKVFQEGAQDSITLLGQPPSPLDPPKGCKFHERCFKAFDKCKTLSPALVGIGDEQVACHEPLTSD